MAQCNALVEHDDDEAAAASRLLDGAAGVAQS